MILTDPAQAAPVIARQIAQAQRIVLLTHINPDGDAIGSLLGLWHALAALGKQATPIASSAMPGYALWLPGIEHVRVYQPGDALPEADLVIMADTASLPRVGKVYDEHAATLTSLPLVIIDHHVTNEGAGTVNLIRPASASTCELLYTLFREMGVPISADLATCLLLGVVTDTQSFQTSATKPESLRITADLLEDGADHRRVVHEVYFALPASSAELIGAALNAMRIDGPIAWTTVSQEMMERTGAEDEAADEVVRMMQRISGVQALALFKERADGTTKISLRSLPPRNVAEIARIWGGGGHAQASGATLMMPPSQAADEVLPHLRRLVGVEH
ncbi:MAG TPA: bifunctional oligoribonuclease/PAP phosphatase NrnA [Roseiflexaceae bacterium]|nr:bifunctional oligoribonuclease/PAP phosphatase NrnA [Roseiflexaceae bacterium]